jgi:hypothetical protein
MLPMPKIITILIFLLLITGCQNNTTPVKSFKGTTFSEQGIRFDCPIGWELSETKKILETEFMVICEKTGEGESGLAIFKWTKSKMTALDLLNSLKDSYAETYKQKHNVEIDYGWTSKKKLKVSFDFNAQSIKHQGKIITKQCPEHVIGIILQETKTDNDKYEKAFNNIENSFACK